MQKTLHNIAYLVGKLNLASVITVCGYLLIYALSIIFPIAESSPMYPFYVHHMLISFIILLALMDGSLIVYLLLKLAEVISDAGRHKELSPPNCAKLNKCLSMMSLGMLLLVGISAVGIWQEQVWAQLLGSFSLFFAIMSGVSALTLQCCNPWLRNHPLIILGMHLVAFLVQVALHVGLVLITLYCIAASL